MVIVDQWNTERDSECLIPLTAFDRTQFRSITGNFDIPHWRRMWECKFPITLPVHFSISLDSHQPFTSMYTLKDRISDGMMNVQSQKESDKVSPPSTLEAVSAPPHTMASGAGLRHRSLQATSKVFHNESEIPRAIRKFKDFKVTKTGNLKKAPIRILKATDEIHGAQVAETDKTRVTEVEIPETVEKSDDVQFDETEKTRVIKVKIPEAVEKSENRQLAETEKTGNMEIVITEVTDQTESMHISEIKTTSETESEISEATEETENIQVPETEKPKEAVIDYCSAYKGYWYNECEKITEAVDAVVDYCTAYKGYCYNE